MLSRKRTEYIKDILARIARNDNVTLEERVYIKKIADQDQKISSWLTRSRRLQQEKAVSTNHPIDELINELDLGSNEPNDDKISNPEELGRWFSGAPSWVTRS